MACLNEAPVNKQLPVGSMYCALHTLFGVFMFFACGVHCMHIMRISFFIKVKSLSLASSQCRSCGADDQNLQWHGSGHAASGWGTQPFNSHSIFFKIKNQESNWPFLLCAHTGQRDRDLELAARIGQSLLHRNQLLQERNEAVEEQLAQALDQVAYTCYLFVFCFLIAELCALVTSKLGTFSGDLTNGCRRNTFDSIFIPDFWRYINYNCSVIRH